MNTIDANCEFMKHKTGKQRQLTGATPLRVQLLVRASPWGRRCVGDLGMPPFDTCSCSDRGDLGVVTLATCCTSPPLSRQTRGWPQGDTFV